MSEDFDEFMDLVKNALKAAAEREEEMEEAREITDKIAEIVEGEKFGVGMEALIMVSVKIICAISDSRMHAMGLSAHMARQILEGCERHPLEEEKAKFQ